MCLIRQTKYYCGHVDTHKINYCIDPKQAPKHQTSTSSSRSGSGSNTSDSDSDADSTGASIATSTTGLGLGTHCKKAKLSLCRTENKSCVVCKLGKGAVLGTLSMAGVKVIIRSGKS